MPLAEIHHNIAPQISIRIIRRSLAEVDIKKWRAAERPTLKKEHAAARLEWAQKYKDWTKEDWKRVIWSENVRWSEGAIPG